MVPANTIVDITSCIKEVMNFTERDNPITYLGCPLCNGRRKIIYIFTWLKKKSKGFVVGK